jgi:hypothetical protein
MYILTLQLFAQKFNIAQWAPRVRRLELSGAPAVQAGLGRGYL